MKQNKHSPGKNKINVMHVVLYLEIGGLETLVMELCKHINKEKFNVSVLCLCGCDGAYRRRLEKLGVPVFLIVKKSRFDILFFLKIMKTFKQEKIDIIHSHSGCFFNAAISAYFANIKRVIYTAHGMPVETGLQADIENKIASYITSKMVAVSGEIKEYLMQLRPSQKNKVMLVINGVDTERFSPNHDHGRLIEFKKIHGIPLKKDVVGSVGRLEPVKNYQMLIHAFAKLMLRYPDNAYLVFIGEGREKENLIKLSENLGVRDNISFLGGQSELQNIYSIIDIFVLPSLTEGTSVSLLEAQSCGIPAIVTNVGENGSIIKNGYNGYVCNVNDDIDMAEKIERLLTDKTVIREMGDNARSTVIKKYKIGLMVNSYEKLYEETMPLL